MKKILDIFRPKRRDHLSEVMGEMTSAERATLRQEKFTLDRLDALRDGGGTLNDWSSAGPGSYGWALNSLESEGLMRCERRLGAEGRLYVYSITPKGRAYLADHEHA